MRIAVVLCAMAAAAALGGSWTNDYSWVRGTHYYPTNDAATIARELGYGKRVGLNTIRIFAYDLAKRLAKACELSQQEEEK